jgi:hypothetical protein
MLGVDIGVPSHALQKFLISPNPDNKDPAQLNSHVQRALKDLLGFGGTAEGGTMAESTQTPSHEPLSTKSLTHAFRAELENLGCGEFFRFFNAQPYPPGPEAAHRLFHHVAQCEACAQRLRENELHAEALLDALRAAAEPDAEECKVSAAADELVAAEQQELVVFGQAVLETLDDTMRAMLARLRPLAPETRAELWKLEEDIPDALFRLALSVAEVSLSLATILSSQRLVDGRASLTVEHVAFHWTNGESKHVEASYFASQVEERTGMPKTMAAAAWKAIVSVASDGRLGLPGLHLENTTDGPTLILADPDESLLSPDR